MVAPHSREDIHTVATSMKAKDLISGDTMMVPGCDVWVCGIECDSISPLNGNSQAAVM